MDQHELQAHVEAQSATIAEQKATIEKLTKDIETMKGSVSATSEELKQLKVKEQELVTLQSKWNERVAKDEQAELAAKFPQITDWSIVKGQTQKEKEEHAASIVKMLGTKPQDTKPVVGDKGNAFKGVPPMGAPNAESLNAEDKNRVQGEMVEAQKKGDLGTVFDKCIQLQK